MEDTAANKTEFLSPEAQSNKGGTHYAKTSAI